MPMVHWPDSMATYSEQDQILFPNDAFGQHWASSERYADEAGLDIIYREAAKYYANIVLPYGGQVLKALEAARTMSFDMIAPSHGVIWRRKEDIQKITALYHKWASHETDKRVVIVYDTMWHSTEAMAQRLYELFYQAGIPVVLMNLENSHMSEVVTEILSARLVLFGSPILNNRMLPTMAGLLMYVKGLKYKNRLDWTFGSYGWATIGFKEMEESIKDAGFELVSEGKYIPYIPDEAELGQLAGNVEFLKGRLLA